MGSSGAIVTPASIGAQSVLTAGRTDGIIGPVRGINAVTARQVITVQRWLSWMQDNAASGSITEIGFPGYPVNATNAGEAVGNWAPVAETVLGIFDSTDTPIFQWVDPTGMFAAINGATTTTPTLTQGATPLIRHRYAGPRGFQAGGAVGIAPPVGFSNSAPITGSNWFPKAQWYQLIAGAGLGVVRLSFRWETIQPVLNGALDATEVARIQSAVALADAAGLKVVLDLHNYAGYITSTGTLKIGGGTLTSAHLADVWTKLSTVFKGDARVYAYELMNEPTGLASAATWEAASQAALTAIRANGDTSLILVPGYDFSAMSRWATNHPVGWITDSASNFRYNAHLYMSSSSIGGDAAYDIPWATEVSTQLFAGNVGNVPLAGELPGWGALSVMAQPQVGEVTTPRHGNASTTSMVSGTLFLTYFRAAKTEDITQIKFRVANAASVDPTLSRIGVWRAGMDGTLTPLVNTANDITMFRSAGVSPIRSLSGTWHKRAGMWYAIGALCVQGSGSLPILTGMSGGAFEWDSWPYTAMTISGLTDLPTGVIAKATLSSNSPMYTSYRMMP